MSKLAKHEQPSSEISGRASLYVLGTLAAREHSDFERHLLDGCRVCNSEVERATAVLSALAESAAATMPSGMRERFRTRMKNDKVLAEQINNGILLRKSGVLIERTKAMEWHAGPVPGMWIKPLFVDKQQQRATSLVRMEPGAHYPSHRHNGPEELFVLEGDFVIEGLVMRSGDYCNAQAASVHGESYTAAGCLFILSACQLDQVLS
jgi:anti-sigma factor ChrR (cupin superfamily)